MTEVSTQTVTARCSIPAFVAILDSEIKRHPCNTTLKKYSQNRIPPIRPPRKSIFCAACTTGCCPGPTRLTARPPCSFFRSPKARFSPFRRTFYSLLWPPASHAAPFGTQQWTWLAPYSVPLWAILSACIFGKRRDTGSFRPCSARRIFSTLKGFTRATPFWPFSRRLSRQFRTRYSRLPQVDISLFTLIVASVVGRGMRFYLVAALMFFFGAAIKAWIERYFDMVAIVFTILLIGGFVLLKYVT